MGRGNESASPKPGGRKENQFTLRKQIYSNPPKDALEAARGAKKRLQLAKAQREGMYGEGFSEMDQQARLEREQQLNLIGELKASEARNRLRVVRLRYEANRAQEVNHLVASQATALEAVRLKVILPPSSSEQQGKKQRDPLGKLERQRLERLIEQPIDSIIRRA